MANLKRQLTHSAAEIDELLDKTDTDYSKAEIDELLANKADSTGVSEDRSALAELVDSGAKNILNNILTTSTSATVNFTVNADKTVYASGTATGGNAQRRLMTIPADMAESLNGMVLSGCPEGGGTDYKLVLTLDTAPYTAFTVDRGEGALIEGVPAAQCRIFIIVEQGCSVDGLFKPMICSKAAWDISHGYVPYRPSYDELIARIEALEGGT